MLVENKYFKNNNNFNNKKYFLKHQLSVKIVQI